MDLQALLIGSLLPAIGAGLAAFWNLWTEKARLDREDRRAERDRQHQLEDREAAGRAETVSRLRKLCLDAIATASRHSLTSAGGGDEREETNRLNETLAAIRLEAPQEVEAAALELNLVVSNYAVTKENGRKVGLAINGLVAAYRKHFTPPIT